MINLTAFYSTLFDEGEATCFTESPYGTAVRPIFPLCRPTFNFFSINPLHPSIDLDPEKTLQDPPRRADCNVMKFRNILIECDEGSPAEQQKYMSDFKVPFSTQVFSGGKSMHFIISLVEPCETRQEYDSLIRRVYERIPKADRANKNPSRLSRAPGAFRGNICQALIYVGARVPRAELEAWLGPAPTSAADSYHDQYVPTYVASKLKPTLSNFTKYFLNFGAEPGRWNSSLFNAACDMTRCGLSPSEVEGLLKGITGRLDARDKRTIRSAIKAASK